MIQYTKTYISELLDKFMAGTSTLEEEDILARYFAQGDIPTEWESYRLLFAEIEAMKPAAKPRRRWTGWIVAAAAVVAGVIYLAVPPQHYGDGSDDPISNGNGIAQNHSQSAQADTVSTVTASPDTTLLPKDKPTPVHTKKKSRRKLEPTIHDYDKAYALMAEAKQEQREVEMQLEQCRMEIIKARLAAYGYIPEMQEDGTIVYINEQTNYMAYEE